MITICADGRREERPLRVLVHTPVRLFGESLAAFLTTIDSVESVLVEHDPDAIRAAIEAFDPGVVLFDVTGRAQLPIARSLRAAHPGLSVVALAVPEVAEDVIACADAGFVAYIPRSASIDEMFTIIDRAARGETICHPRIARSLFDELSRRRRGDALAVEPNLTHREVETARLVARGLSNKEIALQLALSLPTVKNHVHAVLQKLQLSRRSQVGRLVRENPWLLEVSPVALRTDRSVEAG